ncbi:beta-lactamase family protein [Archangium violaceum]|uniref:serine hydrolase domain-containing protein n=1 Tax=Archangium violaceum TaxID=83451 RepID=UPI00194E1E61|nr:serine hydrolase domain-containing protein [Archangium violaceum]QRO01871.1 beta-lactamase family protein [Archangium violaceum]
MHISRFGRISLGTALALWLTGCETEPPPGGETPVSTCERLAPRLQKALETSLQEEDLPGVTASLRLQDCTWHGATGKSSMEPATDMKAEDRLRAGSITKTYVATVMLQLQAEGKLSLDAPLSTWFPDFPRANEITVRRLLNHTSGAANYTTLPDFAAQLESNPGKVWTPEELIALGASASPEFEPGTKWSYSNTNYILAGLIIEKVTGTPLTQQLHTRIFEPLGLKNTGLDGLEPLPALTVRGYIRPSPESTTWMDYTDVLHPSAAGSAGALASTADEVSAFYQALLGGSLLPPQQREEMRQWVSLQSPEYPAYGLALAKLPTPAGELHCHDGNIPGFSALAGYLPERKAAVAVLINKEDANAVGTLGRLLEILASP